MRILIFCLTVSSACAATKEAPVYAGIGTGDWPIVTVKTTDPTIYEDVATAVDYWNWECKRSVFLTAAVNSLSHGSSIILFWDPKLESYGQIVETSKDVHVIRLNPILKNMPATLQTVIRHELGHALGGGEHIAHDPLMAPTVSDMLLIPLSVAPKNRSKYCK